SLRCATLARSVTQLLLAIRMPPRCKRCETFYRRRNCRECGWSLCRRSCTNLTFGHQGLAGGMAARADWKLFVAQRKPALPENISVVFLCLFLFLLFLFVFLAADFREALVQSGLREEILGKTGIVFTGLKENLIDAAAVAVQRDLQRRLHAVHDLIVCVDVRFDAAVGGRIVR